jgi:hypothetical protein
MIEKNDIVTALQKNFMVTWNGKQIQDIGKPLKGITVSFFSQVPEYYNYLFGVGLTGDAAKQREIVR